MKKVVQKKKFLQSLYDTLSPETKHRQEEPAEINKKKIRKRTVNI